jgi:hypothetical protein
MDRYSIIHARVREIHGEDSAIMADGAVRLTQSQRLLTEEEMAAVTPTEAEVERGGMVCSRMQARIALHQAGLLTAAEAAVAESDAVVQIAWADAAEFRRLSPTIAALSDALELSPEQVDDLFRAAMQITV